MNSQIFEEIYEKLKSLILELLKKTWVFIVLAIVLLCVIVRLLELIPFKLIPGSTDAWIGFWSTILGTFFSVIFTLFVMLYTLESDKKSREDDKQPIIIASNTEYDDLTLFRGYPNKNFEHIKDKLFINLINLGQTGVHSITGKVTVLNDEIQEDLKFQRDDTSIKINNQYLTPGSTCSNQVLEFPSTLPLPQIGKNVLEPGGTIPMILPNELVLFAFILRERSWLDKKYFKPKIKIELKYINYRNEECSYSFIATISIKSKSEKNVGYKSNDMEYRIDGNVFIEI